MVIVIHDHFNDSEKTFSGDRTTVLRAIEEVYPWLAVGFKSGQDLEHLLTYIDHQQFLSVEVLDDREHPFMPPG